jgi:curved DNA-binding protein
MDYKDYYAILGVPKNATEKDIKAAYRRLARKWHPDLNPQNKKQSEAKFKEINEANEVLSDPERRKKYDELGANWKQYDQWQNAGGQSQGPFQWGGFGGQGGGQSGSQGGGQSGGQYRTMTQEELEQILGGLGGSAGGGGFSDFFNMFFGAMGQQSNQATRRQRRGQDYEYPVEITLEEACAGTQRVLEMTGEDGKPKRLEVKIPAGVDTGARVRMSGLGGQGSGGQRGDVYLLVTVLPSTTYERKGSDLYTDLPVDLTALVLGGEVAVTTPRGSRLAVKIAPETQNGTTIRLAGQGMPASTTTPDQRGDLYVRVKAVLPTRLSPRERELFDELKRSRGA